jgi:hypothetical protein
MGVLHGDPNEGLAQRVHLASHAGVVHNHLHRHHCALPKAYMRASHVSLVIDRTKLQTGHTINAQSTTECWRSCASYRTAMGVAGPRLQASAPMHWAHNISLHMSVPSGDALRSEEQHMGDVMSQVEAVGLTLVYAPKGTGAYEG